MADHRTVTAAAAALHLTPSAVSQQLAALEHEVGHRLLERDGRGVRLTAVGQILLGHANEVLAQLERAEAEIAAYTTGTAGEVKVASFATAIGLVVAPAIGRPPRQGARASRYGSWTPRATRASPWSWTARWTSPSPSNTAAPPPRTTGDCPGPPLLRAVRRGPSRGTTPWRAPGSRTGTLSVADLAGETWIGPYPGNPCHDVIALACEHAGFHPSSPTPPTTSARSSRWPRPGRAWRWCPGSPCAASTCPGW